MTVSYVGLVKKNRYSSKVLVMSLDERFYVWTALHEDIDKFRIQGSDIPNSELELASEHQVDLGRGNFWKPNEANVIVSVEFHGIVSGGQQNKRVLVKLNGVWSTVAIPMELANSLSVGDFFPVDIRLVSPARKDHIRAGLGLGTLERVKKAESANA